MAKTVLQKRLQELYKKCNLISQTDLRAVSKDMLNRYSGWTTTVYGDRGFVVDSDGTFAYLKITHDKYCDMSEPIFKITFPWGKVKIEPIISMTAHEIDLAIYEIEQLVEEQYSKAINLLNSHGETEGYFNRQKS